MFDPSHCGLYFTQAHIQRAREQQDTEPFKSAWALLHKRRQLGLLELAQHNGLLYRFADDVEAGARAASILQQDNLIPEHSPMIEVLAAAVTLAQCFEMVRDHPAFTEQAAWLDYFAGMINQLNQPAQDLHYVDYLWLNALNLAAAVVLEDEGLFTQAVNVFKGCIQNDVHPEGYIRKAVEGAKEESLYRMLLAAQALILTAEAATHAGENLWTFNERGVSALTPTPYLLYYYYYPEKWRWGSDAAVNDVPEEGAAALDIEAAQALYRRHAGLWEMAQHWSPSKDRLLLLDDMRPVYDLWGGGLVTLTHGGQKPRRFGLFS